jgi:hypothetical protein
VYRYQLTEWVKDKGELRYAIKQIEQYEGKGKGFIVREDNGRWAVYTKGDLVVEQGYIRKPKSEPGECHRLLQYTDIIRGAKR